MAANWTAFVAGAVLTADQLNGVVDNFADVAIFNETQTSGTAGGASTASAFTKRTLNTTVVNNIGGCSLATSVVTLATAGTYYMRASTPTYQSGFTKTRIRNTTASSDTAVGQNADASNLVGCSSIAEGIITITTSTNFEVQTWVQVTKATNGFGAAVSSGSSEIYSQLFIARIA